MDTAQILPNLPPAAKLLFVRLRSLGDTLLSTPLYAALKAWRPDLRITALVENPFDEVLINNPDLDEVLTLPLLCPDRFSEFRARVKAVRAIRAKRFDCCINLHGGSISSILTGLSGSHFRVGLKTFRIPILYNVHIDIPSLPSGAKRLHTVEYQLGWLHFLGLPAVRIPPLKLIPDPMHEPLAVEKMARAGIDLSKPFGVIQPTSKFSTKEWTAEGFAGIADYLKHQFGTQVLLTGGPGENGRLERIRQLCEHRPALLSNLSISELACVLRKARVFIGNDSGPTHMAAALQVPMVELFGSSDSEVWYPWQAPHQIVQNHFECNPCPGYRCLVYGEPRCILSITEVQVKAAIDRVLGTSVC